MGEAAGAGAEIGGEAAGAGAGKGGGLGDFASSVFGGGGDAIAPIAGGAGDLAGATAGASPFVLDSPISAGAFDYLGGAAAGGADLAGGASPFVIDSPISAGSFDYLGGAGSDLAGAGTGFTTSNASLGTGVDSFAGSPLPGSTASGQPFAAGGTTTGAGATIDPASAGPQLSAPTSGQGASSIAPAAPGAAAGAPADATSSWTDMLKKGLTSNPLGTAIAAGGLGYNILQGQKQTANQAALSAAAGKATENNTRLTDAGIAQVGTNQQNAADIGAKGKDLEQYLTTGQLPAQYTQQVDQAINDAKTTAISNAAKNGQPTDPTKNTSLAQQLAQIDNQRAGMTSKIAETLFNAGAGLTNTAANVGNASASSLLSGGQSAANLSGQLYQTLTGIDSKQSEQTAKAIAALAQSLNSGTPQKQAA